MLTVIDVETTYQGRWGSDDGDPMAYNPNNKLVSVGYKTTTGEEDYLIFNHKEFNYANTSAIDKLQDVFNRSQMIIGHNLKFDMTWLFESGFEYNGKYYDTMIYEYLALKGMKDSLRLEDVLIRYGLQPKTDVLDKYCGEQGLNVDEVPLNELIEYGKNDINRTYDLFIMQRELLRNNALIKSTAPALKLMNEFLEVLIDVERSGVKIDIDALDKVEAEFKGKLHILEDKLKNMVQEVMGHTPINLNSPEQMSWVLHSVNIKDKKKWAEIFNLGTEERNGVTKQKYVKRYSDVEFRQILRENCETLYKTEAYQCPTCRGTGYIQRFKQDGNPRKNKNLCHGCARTGLLYKRLPSISGFKIKPLGYDYVAAGGFSSSKETLDDLLAAGVTGQAKEFIEALKEYNAISSYLTSFVEGIRKNVRHDGLLHTNFNQCVTATGRLSSTRPNLQNQPREKTFPIRKVFVSRFVGGKLLNADFSQLEFRVAAVLAQCLIAMADIRNKIDVHKQTADFLTNEGQFTERQDAKKDTFGPLFGKLVGTPAQTKYFEFFLNKYTGIGDWHIKLCDFAIANKYIQSPSGRIYAFPHAIRRRNGTVAFHTQIKNYLVQGFATGDILPTTMIEVYSLMKLYKVKSLLVLTVHDSIVSDIYPGELDLMIRIYREAFANTIGIIKQRFNYDFNIPLDFDLDCGENLLDKKKIL